MNPRDTIVAVSTPPGRGGLGVVRISGEQAREVAAAILRLPERWEWRPWCAGLAVLVDRAGEPVDQVVVTYFARPKSYTAEDVVEISCHGAPVVLSLAVERACEAGARPAEPGEFTLRAFLNGRIDLPQAEAVRDLIEATTLYQAKVAARQAAGGLSRRISPLKEKLLDLVSLLEAGIDFAEDDVPVAGREDILPRLEQMLAEIRPLAASYAYGRLVAGGLAVAIVGRPNVGKSSLFNRLLEQNRAIVTDIPRTTRDLVSETTLLDGIPVRYLDTAGVREAAELIESLGIERTYQAMADADLTLVVIDLSEPLTEADLRLIDRARGQGKYLLVGNKADLPRRAEPLEPALAVSALTGEGIAELRRQLAGAFAPDVAWGTSFVTNVRHARLLEECRKQLEKALETARQDLPHELLLVDLYAALAALDALTGATTAEDILGRIFSTFCIGK